MANARKCDRCGVCFDPFEMEGMSCRFENPMFQNSHDIEEGVVGKLLINASPDNYIDLCPECAEMFEAFFSGCDLPADSESYYLQKPPDGDTDGDTIDYGIEKLLASLDNVAKKWEQIFKDSENKDGGD